MSVAQFDLLRHIAGAGTISHADLGWRLGLDQTTVSCSLAILKRRGLIVAAGGRSTWAALYELELVEIIVDAGQSAKHLDRPGLQRALAKLKAGEAEALLVELDPKTGKSDFTPDGRLRL